MIREWTFEHKGTFVFPSSQKAYKDYSKPCINVSFDLSYYIMGCGRTGSTEKERKDERMNIVFLLFCLQRADLLPGMGRMGRGLDGGVWGWGRSCRKSTWKYVDHYRADQPLCTVLCYDMLQGEQKRLVSY